MALVRQKKLFGSPPRTAVLMLLALLQESFPSELARLLGLPRYSVQNILDGLEREGVIASTSFGRTRRVRFNPRYVAAEELRALLWKLAKEDVNIQKAAAQRRGRPRRPGKPG
jgi:sugar-specific transcriptional regulator TrmB